MYETKLPMTEEEICRNYRSAKSPKEQINILADLNVTDRRTIIDILYRHGELSSNAIGAYIRHGQLPESARPVKPASKEKKAARKSPIPKKNHLFLPRRRKRRLLWLLPLLKKGLLQSPKP